MVRVEKSESSDTSNARFLAERATFLKVETPRYLPCEPATKVDAIGNPLHSLVLGHSAFIAIAELGGL